MRRLTIPIADDLHAKLSRLADQQRRSLTAQIQWELMEAVKDVPLPAPERHPVRPAGSASRDSTDNK